MLIRPMTGLNIFSGEYPMTMKYVLTLFAVCALVRPALAADTPVATVTAAKGVVLLHQTGRSAPSALAKGDKLFAGDEITTEHNGSVTASFDKGATVALGHGGQMMIAAPGGAASVTIPRGAFAATGAAPAIDFGCGSLTLKQGRAASAERAGACAVYLHEGTATVKNPAGLTVLTAGQGTTIKGKGAAETPATWTEEQVSWMRPLLPADTVPSLKIAPPAPAAAAPAAVEAAPATPVESAPLPDVSAAPVSPVEAAPQGAVVTPAPVEPLVETPAAPEQAVAPVEPLPAAPAPVEPAPVESVPAPIADPAPTLPVPAEMPAQDVTAPAPVPATEEMPLPVEDELAAPPDALAPMPGPQ